MKNPLKSKTMWMGLLTGLSPFIAYLIGWDFNGLIAGNEDKVFMVWGAMAIILRLVTKDKIKLLD